MAITAHRYRRVEIWSNWAGATGVRQVVIPDVVGLTVVANVLGTDKLTLTLPTNSIAAPFINSGSIIRVDQDDTPTFDEWKIVEGPDDDDVTGMRSCVAAPIRSSDLATCDIIRRIDSDGTNVPDFESVGLTPALHISTWIIPALTRSGLTFVVAGTITPTGNYDMTYAWDSPLSALTRLAEITLMELDIRRTGSGYAIDLVPAVGSSAPVADVRLGRNLVNLRRTRIASEQVTRVFPRGMQTDNAYANMSRATWRVSVIAGSVVTLVDPAGGAGPIQFDGQLAGTSGTTQAYLRKIDGTLTAVTASSSVGQTVTVASVTGITVNDLVQFRADSAGNDLLSLDSPPDWASYGLRAAPFDVPDVASTNNLLKNSVMRTWPGSTSAPPTNWTALGAPTIGKQTAGPFTAIGGNSIHVTATLDGQGVISDAVSLVGLTALNPYVSGFARVWGVSGQFRVELVFTIPSGTTTLPVLPDVASNTVNGQFVDLGLSGINAFALGATAVQLRVVQHGTVAAEFYVDAGQATISDTQLPFAEGSGGTRLWQAANDRLRQMGQPLLSYEIPIVDLAAVNPGLWAADTQLAIGGQVRVTDARFALTIVTRLMELQRDYKFPGNTKIVLSNKPDDVTGTLARPPRPARNDIVNPALVGGPFKPTITYVPDALGNVDVLVAVSNTTTAVRAVANINGVMPTANQVNLATGQAVLAGALSFNFDNLLTGLVTGDRYNIAVRAYDAAGVPSDMETLSDVYISGVLGATPGVVIGTPVVSPSSITFPITPNLHTTNFEVYVKEYDADPGTLVDVDGAYMTPYDDVVVGPAAPARVAVGSVFNLSIPIGASTNWLMVTIIPYNAYVVGTKSRAKAQGGGTAVLVPAGRANVSHTSVQVINSVTMPATPPSFINVYRDNVFISQVAVTAGAGVAQTMPADTGLTPSTSYSYTYASSTGGVESLTKTAPLVVTTDAAGVGGGALPTPTLNGYYENGANAFEFSITPGDSTPGVTWHVERATSGSGGTYSDVVAGGSTELQWGSPMGSGAITWWFKAYGTKTGYTTSTHSAFIAITKPKAGSPF